MINIAIVGYGNLGRGVKTALQRSADTRFAALFTRRPEQLKKEVKDVPVLSSENPKMPADLKIAGLRDSKKVPEKERATLFWDILLSSLDIGVGIVEHDEIDRINILQATRLAMEKAGLCERRSRKI